MRAGPLSLSFAPAGSAWTTKGYARHPGVTPLPPARELSSFLVGSKAREPGAGGEDPQAHLKSFSLEPDAGVRKGPGAAKRRWSWSEPPCQAAATVPLPSWWVPTMEEMVIWEQHTVTLSKDPQRGFGFAVSGGRDHPSRTTGDTAVFVSDVVAGGPAMGRLQPTKPITSVLVKQKQNEEYGVKLGSQLFIKHIVESGLAAKGSSLQEGDLILKINGVASQDMSLAETQQLIERTEGILTLLILRDHRQFLVNIPDVDSQSDSSRMDDISDIDSELSHPPSPDASPQSPAAARMNSPLESRRSTREPVAEVTMADARGLDPLEAVEGDDHSPHTAPRAALRDGYSADSRVVRFVKAKSAGLRLAGGNDVGIFVSSVQEGSPADSQGVREGDQILQVNDTSFQHLTREEAVEHLMALPVGEEVTLWTQSKPDIYRKMISSNVGDSFYIRTHFDFEKDTPSGLSFVRGDVFHVLDTMYRGRLGNWLAVRVGRDLQEQDKGIIPNQSRAEQIASLESVLKTTSGANPSGARAEFWKLRGLRGAKKMLRKSREDLSALTKQGRYPPYERVVLKEASFKRPVVILGPIADIAMQKLSRELPELFEIAPSVPRDGASSKVIKLDSVQQIAEKVRDLSPVLGARRGPGEPMASVPVPSGADGPSGYLTCDSHANSDYEDTDGEAGAYTDGEAEDAYDHPGLARSSEPAQLPPSHGLSSEPAQVSPSHGLSSSEPAQVSPRHGQSDKVPKQPQQGQRYDSIRAYEHEAVRKRFTHARDDSDQDEGYEWGPATDV
ncbi:tight junction protein ZO-3 [Manacus vitellinus]|uniref:tight junction protein ZO-3 n=1 Tax=Manacus vitellinus TaxID=328815 RepID=UPI00115EFDEA|nr:tight junction protein ZO-3 [Manacus vitellinus]